MCVHLWVYICVHVLWAPAAGAGAGTATWTPAGCVRPRRQPSPASLSSTPMSLFLACPLPLLPHPCCLFDPLSAVLVERREVSVWERIGMHGWGQPASSLCPGVREGCACACRGGHWHACGGRLCSELVISRHFSSCAWLHGGGHPPLPWTSPSTLRLSCGTVWRSSASARLAASAS